MSRVGKNPVEILNGVKLTLSGEIVRAEGPNGKLERRLPDSVSIDIQQSQVVVTPSDDSRRAQAMHGLARTLINNMVLGVTKGFEKRLQVVGVGYRVENKDKFLVFSVGYSHPIWYELPTGVSATIEKDNKIVLAGANKEVVGQAAATIRAFRPPEPYKGKGIRYENEVVRHKVGKAGAAA